MAANASKFNGYREIVDTFLCLSFFNFGQTFALNTTNLKFESNTYPRKTTACVSLR